MAEVYIHSNKKVLGVGAIKLSIQKYHVEFSSLLAKLFQKGNDECDVNHVTVVVLTDFEETSNQTGLNGLNNEDKLLLLRYYFSHLNLLVVELDPHNTSLNTPIISHINHVFDLVNKSIDDRITRVQTWTGTGDYDLSKEINEIISTMSTTINTTVNKPEPTIKKITHFKDLIIEEIDFKSLLSNNSTSHLLTLCNLVGHWSFPAHELSNDDLIYCVYLIIRFCLTQIDEQQLKVINLDDNELLCLIFMIRDTYKNGNPFHNFRHAVDVLQACFHYVIRLGYLPSFTQFQNNPHANELICLNSEKFGNAVELIPINKWYGEGVTNSTTSLNSIQTLTLLVAALGHDVAHPGVTNAFLIKYSSPASLLYNEKSVLELFHTSIFLNRILIINWPQLLNITTDDETKLSAKDLIISSILATDMAEHFEYIDKLTNFRYTPSILKANRVKLIASLLIKCADISNVTRPLRVSSQWASVLSREFEEIAKLEKKISTNTKEKFPISYNKVPSDLEEILKANPDLHKGQIFFINTFAENLFNNIGELLPQLKYTCDIVKENKNFWLQQSI